MTGDRGMPAVREDRKDADAKAPSSPPWSLTTKTVITAVVLILLGLAIWRFRSLIAPITVALLVAYLLNPLISLVGRRLNLSRGRAVALVYLVLIAAGTIIGAAVGVATFREAVELYERFPDLVAKAAAAVEEGAKRVSTVAFVFRPLPASEPIVLDLAAMVAAVEARELAAQVVGLAEPIFTQGSSLVAQLAQMTLSALGIVLLIFALSIYVARDGPRFWDVVTDLAHQSGYRADAERLIDDFAAIWNAYLRGQVLLALVMGGAVTITLSVLGVGNALALGALSALLEFLPLVGAFIGTAAAALVALFQPTNYLGLSPWLFALLVALVMLVLQALENNLLVPRIVGGVLDLHPLVVIVGVLMGASLAGILGAILAAPVLATIKLLGIYTWRKLLDLPPFPE